MTVLIGVLLLVLSFLCHVIMWRVRLPRRQSIGLLAVFGVAPLLALSLAKLTRIGPVVSPAEAGRVALFYVAFALAYIVCYSAIENESPTLAIVSFVSASGSAGCTDAELFERFGRGATIEERLALIERGGWIAVRGDRMRLSPEGRFYGRIFEVAARVFGLSKGG